MTLKAPVKLTFYDENDEVKAEYQRLIAPWGLLKRAIRLGKSINQDEPSEDDMDAIADLIIEFFGNKFSREDIDAGCDIGDVMAAFMTIVSKANGDIPNPPPREKPREK